MTKVCIPPEALTFPVNAPVFSPVDPSQFTFLYRRPTDSEIDAFAPHVDAAREFFGARLEAAQEAMEEAERVAAQAKVEREADPRVAELEQLLSSRTLSDAEWHARHKELQALYAPETATRSAATSAVDKRDNANTDLIATTGAVGFLAGQVHGVLLGLELAASFRTEPEKWEALGGTAAVLTRMLTDQDYRFMRIYHLMAAKEPAEPGK